jgi:hypothetical protein
MPSISFAFDDAFAPRVGAANPAALRAHDRLQPPRATAGGFAAATIQCRAVTGAFSVQPDGRSGAWVCATACAQTTQATETAVRRRRMGCLWLVESDILARM